MLTETDQILGSHLTAQVVNHFRTNIEDGILKPGDKVLPERDLAKVLNISRASLRTGIKYLVAAGVMEVHHGRGTFVSDGPAVFGQSSLELQSALHNFEPWQIFEVRQVLECDIAALAAERGRDEHLMVIAEELAEMYATMDDPREYLLHDVCFHRAIAQAADNPILASLMDSISTMSYEDRSQSAEFAPDQKKSMQEHREIYHTIRARNPEEARAAMARHLIASEADLNKLLSAKKPRFKHTR